MTKQTVFLDFPLGCVSKIHRINSTSWFNLGRAVEPCREKRGCWVVIVWTEWRLGLITSFSRQQKKKMLSLISHLNHIGTAAVRYTRSPNRTDDCLPLLSITVLLLCYYWVITELWLTYDWVTVFSGTWLRIMIVLTAMIKKKNNMAAWVLCFYYLVPQGLFKKKKCWGSFLFLLLILLSNYCSPVQLYIHSLTRCWKMARVNQQFQMTSRKTSTVEPLSGAATAWPLLPTRRRGEKNAIHFTEHGKRISPQRESAIVLPSGCVAENSQTNCNMKNSTKRFPRRCST